MKWKDMEKCNYSGNWRLPSTKDLKTEQAIIDPDAKEYRVKPKVVGVVVDSWDDLPVSSNRDKSWKNRTKQKSQWGGKP